MSKKPIVAIMYDFDRTLSPKDMQEYSFIPSCGMTASEFWGKCDEMATQKGMDSTLAYMFYMLDQADRVGMHLTRSEFNKLGDDVILLKGVDTWFKRINEYGKKIGVEVEHYVLSSGLYEIIEATPIFKEFKKVYASCFSYNDYDEPIWPAIAVNYTSKTQFLFRINKGVLDVTENGELNASMAEENKRIPFSNMIYVGDGFTDVPCMKIVKQNGGHSIAVYTESRKAGDNMILHDRVDYVMKADYSENEELEQTMFAILDLIKAQDAAEEIHEKHIKKAKEQ